MDHQKLESGPNIHVLGLSYVYSYLSCEGYTIYEVNTDPNHHAQILAKRANKLILVAVRTAYHPEAGTIDKEKKEQLIKESDQLNAIPHFAGLAVTPLDTKNLGIERFTKSHEYEVTFNGITTV